MVITINTMEGYTKMIKEIKFSEDQSGFGLAFTDPATGIRNLVGIFDTQEEAYKYGQAGIKNITMIRPEVIIWNKKNYGEYHWVYKK